MRQTDGGRQRGITGGGGSDHQELRKVFETTGKEGTVTKLLVQAGLNCAMWTCSAEGKPGLSLSGLHTKRTVKNCRDAKRSRRRPVSFKSEASSLGGKSVQVQQTEGLLRGRILGAAGKLPQSVRRENNEIPPCALR